MTAVLYLAVFVAGGVGGSLGTHRHTIRRVRSADVAHYQNAWDTQDREALLEEVAHAVADKGRWHRNAVRIQQVARAQAGLLVHRRRPIPMPARTGYPLDYGRNR